MTDVELRMLYALLGKYRNTYIGLAVAIEKLQNQIRIKCESRGISPDNANKDVKITGNSPKDFVKLKTNDAISVLNLELQDVGISFQKHADDDGDYMTIEIDHGRIVNAKKLLSRKKSPGRPRKDLPIDDIRKWKEQEMTNAAIIRKLDMCSASFYAKMKTINK